MSSSRNETSRPFTSATTGARFGSAEPGWIVPIGLAVIVATVAAQGSNLFVLVFNFALITAMLALSLSLIFNQVGLISIAHAAYFGIGAYTSALLTRELGFPFLLGALGACIVTGLLGYLLVPMAKLEVDYYAMGTLAFGLIVYALFGGLTRLTGGWTGLSSVPGIELFGLELTSGRSQLIFLAVVLLLQYLLVRQLTKGYVGRSFTAVRDDNLSAQAIGIRVNAVRLQAVTIGCMLAGLTGSLMAHMNQFVSPESFAFLDSVMLVLIVAIAGRGNLGVVVGVALGMHMLDDWLSSWPFIRPILYGSVIVLSMIFLPNGVSGLLEKFSKRARPARLIPSSSSES